MRAEVCRLQAAHLDFVDEQVSRASEVMRCVHVGAEVLGQFQCIDSKAMHREGEDRKEAGPVLWMFRMETLQVNRAPICIDRRFGVCLV